MDITIETEYLKELFHLIIEKLEKEYGTKICLNTDYYWTLDENEKYNMDIENPKEILLNQISFDIENLKRLKNSSEVLLSNDLITIANLLKSIRNDSRGKW